MLGENDKYYLKMVKNGISKIVNLIIGKIQ